MASKYAGQKGKIPAQETARDEALQKMLDALKVNTLEELTNLYNGNQERKAALAAAVKANALHEEALELTIQDRLTEQGADAVSINGYTWSEKFEPYPSAEDPAAIIKYFKEHEMEDQLVLKASELAARLKTFVKEEALNNELDITTETVDKDGVPTEVTVVRSKIPGVRVFLKTSLSRVKTSKGAK